MKQRVFLDLPVEMLEKLSMAVAKTVPRSLIRYWHATGTFCPRIYRRLLKTSFTDQWQVEEILSFGGPIYVKILKELDFDLTEPIISSVLNPFRRALLGTLYGKPLSQRCLPLGRVFPKVVCERDLLYLFEIEAVSFPIKVDDLSRLRNRGFWESLRGQYAQHCGSTQPDGKPGLRLLRFAAVSVKVLCPGCRTVADFPGKSIRWRRRVGLR